MELSIADIIRQVKANKSTLLEDQITTYMCRTEKRDPLTLDTHARVSQVVRMCPREESWYGIKKQQRDETIDGKTRLIFDVGSALHDMIRNGCLAPMGILIGSWRGKCGHLNDGRIPKPLKCKTCAETKFVYEEEHIFNDEYLIKGHPDGFIRADKMRILEIKTCNDKSFQGFQHKGVNAPYMDSYVKQLQLYMWLTGLTAGRFLMFNKNTSAMTTIDIDYDESVAMTLLGMLCDVRVAIKEGKLLQCSCFDKRHNDLSI